MRDLMIWKAGNRCVIYSQLILFSAAFCVSVVLHTRSHSVWHTQCHAHLHHTVSWPLCEALHFCCWGDRKLPYRALRKINMPCWIFHFFFSLSVCWGRAAKISIILQTKVQAIWFNLVPSLLAEPLQPPDSLPSAAVIFHARRKLPGAKLWDFPRKVEPKKRLRAQWWQDRNNEGDREVYTPLISWGLYKFKDSFNLTDKDERMRMAGKGEVGWGFLHLNYLVVVGACVEESGERREGTDWVQDEERSWRASTENPDVLSEVEFSWGSAPSFLGSTISLSITSPLAQGFSAQEDHG